MTDRDRLIELMLNAPQILCIKGGRATGKRYQTFQNIADHLLANGVIVPPCKVGDKVYWVNMGGTLTQAVVTEVFQARTKNGFEYDIPFAEIGKTVFLTKEEAEAKLKEREGNES